MIEYDEECSWWQVVRAAVAVSEMLTQLISVAFLSFLSPFIRFLLILIPLLSLAAIVTRPVLTQPLHQCLTRFVTFECERNANWAFLLQDDVAGDGSTKTNIKMKTKWLWLAAIVPAWYCCNTSRFSPNLYTTASHVLRIDLRDLRVWKKCKLAFPSAGWRLQVGVAGDGSTITKIKMKVT